MDMLNHTEHNVNLSIAADTFHKDLDQLANLHTDTLCLVYACGWNVLLRLIFVPFFFFFFFFFAFFFSESEVPCVQLLLYALSCIFCKLCRCFGHALKICVWF